MALKHVTKKHTAENLLSELREVISDWNVGKKVIAVSADGAYNIKKAITESGDLEYINCLAHLLNLVVKLLFESTIVMPLLAKCRKLVGTFKHSTTLSEQLTNTIKSNRLSPKPLYNEDDDEVDLEIGLEELVGISESSLRTKLVQDLVTRWNSTLAMLSSVFESHSAIRMVITSDSETKAKYQHELLSDDQLGIVEDLILLLDPFLEMTKLISGSKYVTSSIVLPATTRLLECLGLYEPSNGKFKGILNLRDSLIILNFFFFEGNDFVKDIARLMFDDLEKRALSNFNNSLLLAACFMDPRYRNFRFIKDQNTRDLATFKAQKYIKCAYSNIFR